MNEDRNEVQCRNDLIKGPFVLVPRCNAKLSTLSFRFVFTHFSAALPTIARLSFPKKKRMQNYTIFKREKETWNQMHKFIAVNETV